MKTEERESDPAFTGAPARFFASRIVILAALSVILVIALGVFASRSLATLNEGTEWVMHAQRVRYQLSHILQLLVDMGGGLRRFEMTHDESSIQQAELAALGLPADLAALHAVLADEKALQTSETELIKAAEQRAAQARTMIGLARTGRMAELHAMIERGDNLTALNRCREIIAQMQERETQNYERHRRMTETARRSVAFAIVATTALAVLLLILVAFVSTRHSARQRAAQQALIDREAALREADHRKDVFLATLSHELRNPLAPIRNAARLLESPSLTPGDLERNRAIISRQVRHMASLLDDLLDVSRITRGVLTLKKEIVGLKALFEAALETARPAIEAKRHRLTVEWPDERVYIEADAVRLTQVITNLLTNAAKYTDPEGDIVLGSRTEGRTIVIYVRDSGIGLAPHMLTKVFEMFSQVSPARGHADGGLGIGLALVKGLVDMHGGQVLARSAGLEQGSEFIVSFPHSLIDGPSAAAAPQIETLVGSPNRPLRVLIADDNQDSAESLGMLLELSGHQVLLAHNGADALRLAADNLPDVALLDIGMPGMDGYQVAAAMRREAWGANMLLVAITGWGQDDDKRRASGAGFDHHLTKPMDSAALQSILIGARAG